MQFSFNEIYYTSRLPNIVNDRQHVLLTIFETYSIQFSVLAQTKKRTIKNPPRRPIRYHYATFKSQYPLSSGFEAIFLDIVQLLSSAETASSTRRKPSLICVFCDYFKKFKTNVGLQSYIFYSYSNINDTSRLAAIRKIGFLQRNYQAAHYPQYFNEGNKTQRMLQQLERNTVSWSTVQEWKLRRD